MCEILNYSAVLKTLQLPLEWIFKGKFYAIELHSVTLSICCMDEAEKVRAQHYLTGSCEGKFCIHGVKSAHGPPPGCNGATMHRLDLDAGAAPHHFN